MKITLEFSSYSEMMTFCRERVSEKGPGPTLATPSLGEEPATAAEPLALGKRQTAVLTVLADGESRETKKLADEVGISVPSLSSTLKSLAKRGLVQKVRWGVWAATPNATGVALPSNGAPPPSSPAPKVTAPETVDEPAPKKAGPPVGKANAVKKPSKKEVDSSVDEILADL